MRPYRFLFNLRCWRRQIFKSLFGKAPTSPAPILVRDMSELRPYLTQSGFVVEDRDPVEILGIRMERVRMRQSGAISAVAFGGGFFHIVQVIGLTRALTPKEVVDFNASVQIFNLTPNEEPPLAIIKTHVPSRFGALPQNIISLLSLSDDVVQKLVAVVGPTSVRAI